MGTESQDTKLKILTAASELFAKFGFAGTSVRDIAAASSANIAAISYHFGSKSNLYWAVVFHSHEWFAKGIEELSHTSANTKELASNAFEFLLTDKDSVRTTLKLMLSDGVTEPTGDLDEKLSSPQGPPGHEHFKAVIHRDLGESASEEALSFAVKSIMGLLIHYAMLHSSAKFELMKKDDPSLCRSHIKTLLSWHTEAVLDYVRKHPALRLES